MRISACTLLAVVAASVPLLSSAQSTTARTNGTGINYTDCAPSIYYAGLGSNPDTWTKSDIIKLLTTTHRQVLPAFPNKNSSADIILALKSVWNGSVDSSVRIVYKNVDFPSDPFNTVETWRRADFWPEKRGAIQGSPAFTDVHSKAPGKWTIENLKEDLFYGFCGTVEDKSKCAIPANAECAPSTSQDAKTFKPTDEEMGDIARAVFYTAMRYEVDLGLKLSDCPPFSNTTFGYLSALLEMHQTDPVSDVEKYRNDVACQYWQGNRNIFVDYPQLVQKFFGTSDKIAEGTRSYSSCISIKTEAPTATPNECSSVRVGDIAIYVFNSVAPQQFVLFPISNIPAGVGSIFVTNNPWNGTNFLATEGTIEMPVPSSGLRGGYIYGYGTNSSWPSTVGYTGNWTSVGKSIFNLSTTGDNMFVYCIDADNKIRLISGLIYGANWSRAGLASYNRNETALPDVLARQGVGYVALAEKFPNWLHNGTSPGTRDALLIRFANATNYVGSNKRFSIKADNRTSSAVSLSLSWWTVVVGVASLAVRLY